MKKRLSVTFVTLAAVAVFCSGCVVTCTHPPFDLSRAEDDPALAGRWLVPEGEGGGVIEFRRTRDAQFQVHVEKGKGGRRGPLFEGYSGRADGRRYLWLALINEGEEKTEAGRILVRYEVRGDTLTFWLLNREKVRAAVNEGKLLGGGVGGEGEVRLNGPPEELAAAIKDL